LPVSFPFQLDQRLRARYPEQEPVVLNAGLVGEKAADALPRLRTVLTEADAQVLLLLHGVNDLNTRLGTAPTIEAIRQLTREARGRGLRVFLATLPPQCRGGSPPRGGAAAFLPEFNATLAAMGREEGAQIVDLFGNMSDALLGPDCLHPLPAGYVRMADVFFEAIIAAFETRRTTAIAPR
jgi:lysophospholipase L1-like esterase